MRPHRPSSVLRKSPARPTEGTQIHDGYGDAEDLPVERFDRDAKLNETYGKSSEILHNTTADQLGGPAPAGFQTV